MNYNQPLKLWHWNTFCGNIRIWRNLHSPILHLWIRPRWQHACHFQLSHRLWLFRPVDCLVCPVVVHVVLETILETWFFFESWMIGEPVSIVSGWRFCLKMTEPDLTTSGVASKTSNHPQMPGCLEQFSPRRDGLAATSRRLGSSKSQHHRDYQHHVWHAFYDKASKLYHVSRCIKMHQVSGPMNFSMKLMYTTSSRLGSAPVKQQCQATWVWRYSAVLDDQTMVVPWHGPWLGVLIFIWWDGHCLMGLFDGTLPTIQLKSA